MGFQEVQMTKTISAINHEALLELDGFWAYEIQKYYKNYKVNSVIIAANSKFRIADIHKNNKTGLDAITFQDQASGEYVVIYVGTQGGTDIMQDAQLITAMTPSQYANALAYLKQQPNKISYVGGNSLGGGLALYAGGIEGVPAVTLNPAPVPKHMQEVNTQGLSNYIIENDPLFNAVNGGGLGSQIIGQKIMLEAGLFGSQMIKNHTGFYVTNKDKGKNNSNEPVKVLYGSNVENKLMCTKRRENI